MSDDLINKKEALDLLRKRSQQLVGIYGDLGGAVSGAARLIDELPSADRPRGEWIPCSERLPKSYVEVLVCDDCGWINLGAYRPCDISEDCSGWSIHAHTKIGTEEVVAWMPLPAPWEGSDDE